MDWSRNSGRLLYTWVFTWEVHWKRYEHLRGPWLPFLADSWEGKHALLTVALELAKHHGVLAESMAFELYSVQSMLISGIKSWGQDDSSNEAHCTSIVLESALKSGTLRSISIGTRQAWDVTQRRTCDALWYWQVFSCLYDPKFILGLGWSGACLRGRFGICSTTQRNLHKRVCMRCF